MSVRLFVGNLPYSATDVDIRQHFGTVGDPIQVVIPTDRDTGRPRGFAFVVRAGAGVLLDSSTTMRVENRRVPCSSNSMTV